MRFLNSKYKIWQIMLAPAIVACLFADPVRVLMRYAAAASGAEVNVANIFEPVQPPFPSVRQSQPAIPRIPAEEKRVSFALPANL
jgi:hypothetical protein